MAEWELDTYGQKTIPDMG